jgi:hypothetical protein
MGVHRWGSPFHQGPYDSSCEIRVFHGNIDAPVVRLEPKFNTWFQVDAHLTDPGHARVHGFRVKCTLSEPLKPGWTGTVYVDDISIH